MSSPARAAKPLTAVLVAFAVLQLADVATTFIGLRLGLAEGNAISAAIIGSSPWEWVLLKVLAAAVSIGAALPLSRLRLRRPYAWVLPAAALSLLPALAYTAWVVGSNLLLL
ncbi:MAG: hypothetical protein JRN54_04860 [Nitrososphaerota archaeon]|jgi:hypothetical protein|nr:hypothetical protein [Nitrososphaerota archaeon]